MNHTESPEKKENYYGAKIGLTIMAIVFISFGLFILYCHLKPCKPVVPKTEKRKQYTDEKEKGIDKGTNVLYKAYQRYRC